MSIGRHKAGRKSKCSTVASVILEIVMLKPKSGQKLILETKWRRHINKLKMKREKRLERRNDIPCRFCNSYET